MKLFDSLVGAALAFVIITDITYVKEEIHPPPSSIELGPDDSTNDVNKLY